MESKRISPAYFNAAAKLMEKNLEWKDLDGNRDIDAGELFSNGVKVSGMDAKWKSDALAIQNRARNLLLFPPTPLEPEKIYELDPSRKIIADPRKLVNEEKLATRLLEALPKFSKSCEEKEFAKHVQAAFAKLGIRLDKDNLPQEVASLPEIERKDFYCNNGMTPPNSGNLIGSIPATDPSLPTWNLSFHLDTLQTAFKGFQREGDVIKPAPGTPLGADDKAGYAIIAEVIQAILGSRSSYGQINIVGLVGEEDTAGGAKLIAAEAFKGDILVSADGTEADKIGRAAPTMYKGIVEIRTQTSHPFSFDSVKPVSACAVAAKIKGKWLEPNGHPFGNPNVIFHSFFESCGDEFGAPEETQRTEFGIPMAFPRNNTVSPYATFVVQMRNLEGPSRAAELAGQFKADVKKICHEASQERTPVACTVTNMDQPSLIGYTVNEDHVAVRLLQQGWEAVGMKPTIARQFGGFNGNYIHSRTDIGETMLLTGTGASDLIHTTDETVSIRGMGDAARGLLAAMLLSYRYKRVETARQRKRDE